MQSNVTRAAAKANAGPATPATMTATRARAFGNWDKNKDGVLTLEEYRNGLAKKADAETRFKNFDKNSDGKLTREEFVGPNQP
jgi:Ca2+-binding EF-hand superfamily protein